MGGSGGGGSGGSYIPVDSTGQFVSYNPAFKEDQNGDTAYGYDYEVTSTYRALFHSYTKFSNADAYKKIIIPSQSDEPENPVPFTHTITYAQFTED